MFRSSACLAFVAVALVAAVALADPGTAAQRVGPDNPAAEAALAWYRNAKLGMFVHWGLYSIDGSRAWTRLRNQIPDDQYRARTRSFDPRQFDADIWAQVAKQAGCRWINITAKHHDGFALWDSAVDDFDDEPGSYAYLIRPYAHYYRRPPKTLDTLMYLRAVRFEPNQQAADAYARGLEYAEAETSDEKSALAKKMAAQGQGDCRVPNIATPPQTGCMRTSP
jgi:hypothetical protein